MSASETPVGDDDLRERLTDLEVRVAYQDRLVAALDEVVRELGSRVVSLLRELEEIKAAAAPTADAVTLEPPPSHVSPSGGLR
jgi:uncharacterized coiled-coil protein SlyX